MPRFRLFLDRGGIVNILYEKQMVRAAENRRPRGRLKMFMDVVRGHEEDDEDRLRSRKRT